MFNLNSFSFCDHLRDAIAINSERKKLYAQMTQNRSLWISRALIFFEKVALVFAWFIDRKAVKFHKMGIPVIANDFVPMHSLPSYDTAPMYRHKASKEVLRSIAKDLKSYRKSMKFYVFQGDFMGAAKISYDVLQRIRKMEKEHECHFAMTCHLIESIGFAALHAPRYAKESQGATISLSKTFIRVQMLGLLSSLWFDKQAGAIHRMRVGILVNDVPSIPFEREYLR